MQSQGCLGDAERDVISTMLSKICLGTQALGFSTRRYVQAIDAHLNAYEASVTALTKGNYALRRHPLQ